MNGNICYGCKYAAVSCFFGSRIHVVRCPHKNKTRKYCGIPKHYRCNGDSLIRAYILSF